MKKAKQKIEKLESLYKHTADITTPELTTFIMRGAGYRYVLTCTPKQSTDGGSITWWIPNDKDQLYDTINLMSAEYSCNITQFAPMTEADWDTFNRRYPFEQHEKMILEEDLKKAIQLEDYEEAARLNRKIKRMNKKGGSTDK